MFLQTWWEMLNPQANTQLKAGDVLLVDIPSWRPFYPAGDANLRSAGAVAASTVLKNQAG
jgi:hypothetical protein